METSAAQSSAVAAIRFLEQHWVQLAVSLVLFVGTYSWVRREIHAKYAPSSLLVPSTSTYPSKTYTARRKIPAQQFIDDFLQGRIELRDAQSGFGMRSIAEVVCFRYDLLLVCRVLRVFFSAFHSERRDRQNTEMYVQSNNSLLEEILGPDRLPLVGYIREGMSQDLEASLAVQMQRIGKEYLDLGPDDRLLDVHAQWGDLAVYLAHDHQTPTCAVVATPAQLAHATNLSSESQVQRFLRFVTGDYRAVGRCLPLGIPPFTKVVALDALDMVGLRNVPAFLRSVNDVMEVGGRLLLQVTTTPSSLGYRPRRHPLSKPIPAAHAGFRFDDGGSNTSSPESSSHADDSVGKAGLAYIPDNDLSDDGQSSDNAFGEDEWAEHWWYHWFRQQYIQPGADTSMSVSIEQVMGDLQRAGFEVLQVESLTMDAAMTTAVWCSRLCASKRQIEMEMGEAAYRAWELYLNWTQSLYARGRLHKHFVLAIKH
ncbi:Cyclopropane-fatty-acyl-phospholipid synthase [Coemansia sp. RSA 1200]|nr:Cyclopropane-fatty-acyl-phospholipid synthase [Coemansia sp. RSA 1200]